MEKKLYSKPLLHAEQFAPQEFVAACVPSSSLIPTPVSTSGYYKVDGINTDGSHSSSKLNGVYNTSEQITTMHQLNDTWIDRFFVQGPSKGYHYHIHAAYTSRSGVLQYNEGDSYTNASLFGGPVAVIHQTNSTGTTSLGWYLLSNEYKGESIDSYMSIIKNNS